MGIRSRSRPRRRRARASATPLICLLAVAALGMLGVAYRLIAPDGGTATAEQTAVEARAERSELLASLERGAAGKERVNGVRREPVRLPRAYPGSIADAPAPALAAYQRAQTVINEVADCGLDWTLLAAIGRVESNHGRGQNGGHQVSREGRVKPAMVGLLLDGTGKRGELPDSDYGELDGDRQWDAPIGPMSLLPVTWTAVAVDADGDGRRDPQDLDDAALAAAVVLCTDAGRRDAGAEGADDSRSASGGQRWRAALRAFHNGARFVRTVLLLRERYAQHGTAPSEESSEPEPVPDELPSDEPTNDGPPDGGEKKPKKPDDPRTPDDGPSAPSKSADPTSPSAPSSPSEPTSPTEPTDPPTSQEPSSPPTKSSAPPSSGDPSDTRRSSGSSRSSTP